MSAPTIAAVPTELLIGGAWPKPCKRCRWATDWTRACGGPLINDEPCAKLTALVEDAVGRGATVVCGGSQLERPGSFFAPTVLSEVPADAAVRHEEAFGPIALNRGLVSDPAAPFGGVRQSEVGRERGHEGLLDYTESRYFAIGAAQGERR